MTVSQGSETNDTSGENNDQATVACQSPSEGKNYHYGNFYPTTGGDARGGPVGNAKAVAPVHPSEGKN